jgi:hypothetical protein
MTQCSSLLRYELKPRGPDCGQDYGAYPAPFNLD